MTILRSGAPNWVWRNLWSLRRRLGLSPTQDIFREVSRRGIRTIDLAAVELFAGSGFRHTIDYHRLVSSLEVWEVKASCEIALRRNLPGATVRITDSFEEVRRTNRRFGVIVVDNTITTFGKGHIEHFDLFPDVFRIADDPCVLVLNVCPQVPEGLRRDEVRMAGRAEFYRTDNPYDVPIIHMVEAYNRLLSASGFRLEWHFARRRAHRDGIHYLVLGMTKSNRELGTPSTRC